MSTSAMTESAGASRSSDESSSSISLDKTSAQSQRQQPYPLLLPPPSHRQQQQQQQQQLQQSFPRNTTPSVAATVPLSNASSKHAGTSPLNPLPITGTTATTSSSLTSPTRGGTTTSTAGPVSAVSPQLPTAAATPDRYHPDVGVGTGSVTTPPPVVSAPPSIVEECDYDLNPTVLYQAIEAKQWEYAVSLFTRNKQGTQSSTWVIRKESNGKLRWRLLPLHAAVIFGSPLKLVELLVADYPLGAQSKDDQGMLPLHLAFRYEVHWDVIDELLTAYPMAVFVSDRKGRTPLLCGSSRPGNNNNNNNTNTNLTASASTAIIGLPGLVPSVTATTTSGTATVGSGGDTNRSSFRSVVSVLNLYSQIVVSGERKRAEQEARTLASTGVTQLQDAHYKTLTALKKEWESQRVESKKQMETLENDRAALEGRVRELEREVASITNSQHEAEGKVRRMAIALNQANERMKVNSPAVHQMHRTNQMLRKVTETLVEQQKSYHRRVEDVLVQMQQLVKERETVRAVFLQETTKQQSKEQAMLESFQAWFYEQGRKISVQVRSLEEEKKVEDRSDLVASPLHFPIGAPRPPSGSATSSGLRASTARTGSSLSSPTLPFVPSPTHMHHISSISLPELEPLHHEQQQQLLPLPDQRRARSLGSWNGSSQDVIDLSLIDLSQVKSDD